MMNSVSDSTVLISFFSVYINHLRVATCLQQYIRVPDKRRLKLSGPMTSDKLLLTRVATIGFPIRENAGNEQDKHYVDVLF